MAGVDLATLAIKVTQDGVSQAQSGLDGLTRSGANAERSVGALTTATGGLVSALAKIAAAVGGVYAIERAFQAGIRAVDDFRVSVIGIAATLTDMAKPGQGDMETVFARNKAAAEDMYKAITIEAAKHFSSASEGMMVYNRLVQSGYSVQKSEVSDLLLLTDKIKLATKGQNVEMQLNTEIIALMAGQAKAQSMIAMELQSRLGSGWGDLVKKHRESGDLLKWISSLFPGLVTANKEIEGTLNAQWATTKSLLDLLSIGGLAGAYEDIVGFVKGINEQLKNSEGLVNAMTRAWEGVRDIAKATWGFVSEIYNIVSKAVTWAITISTNIVGPGAKWLSSGEGGTYLAGGQDAGLGIPGVAAKMVNIPGSSSFGLGDDYGFGKKPEPKYSTPWQTNQLAARGISAFIPGANGELIPVYGAEGMAGMPPIKAMPRTATDKGGGGKGTDAAESAMKSFIETMKSETARAAGDTEAILGAWYGKQLLSIEKWKAAGLDTTEALTAADAAYYSKLEKLNSDFSDWYNSGLGNQYEKLVAEEKKKLDTVAGNKAKEAQTIEVYDRKHYDLSQQMETERINLFKGYLDTMAGLSPVLADQLGYKREALALELKLADAALERSRREGKITQDTYEQAQAMQAMVAQAKKFNLEMENNKGLSGWAYGRVKADQGKSTVSDMMGSFESGLQSSFSSAWQGFLTQDKKNLAKAGQSIFQGILGEVTKGSVTKLFSGFAKMISPESPFASSASEFGTGKGLSSTVSGTGVQLSKAAEGLNKASVGFNANTAQFGLAAGGLLLSGIGIATNSQALVYAGMVLQVAGMMIQIYEALSATTTATSMTIAAGALTGSAVGLTGAAAELSIAAWMLAASGFVPFHSGGIITAHQGWPRLASDERIIRAQVGERVLSRSQNRDYEAGMAAGGPGENGTVVHAPITFAPTYNYRPTQQDMNRDAKMMAKALKRELGNKLSG